MVDRQLAFMVYNKYGERFEAGVRMVVLDSLLNLTRQFDACTKGNNDLGGEILGRRRKNEHAKPIHIKFQEEQADSDSDDILLVKKEGGKSTSGANRVQVEDVEERHLRESIYRAPPLNSTQVKAARSFLDATDERIILIQGPPGTGKTTLLVSIICRYLLRAHNASQKRRLLVCAPTNKAVTVLATRVLDAIQHDEATSAVLIGDQDRLLSDHRDTLRPIFCYTWRDVMVQDLKKIERELKPDSNNLSALAMHGLQRVQAIRRQVSSLVGDEIQTILTSLHKNFNNLLLQENNKSGTILALRSSISELIPRLQGWDERQVVQTLLADANIIFCTLTSAGAQVVKETVAVDDVICDEAAAATAPELLICTWLLSKRLLLVGDPSQLPATVHSDYGKENGLDQSLQDRLMNNCNFPYTMLDIQYRMKPEIAQWPIQTFYHSGVSNGANVTALHYQTDVTVLNSQPYAWLHVVGDMQRDSSGSCYNVSECEAVVELLHQLQSRGRRNDWFDVTRIRVITFYQAQVLALQQRLRHKGLSRVTVSTVDSSQGCEANIIILSLVRDGKDGGRVGFLSDVRRLNVALTRAQHQLVCVGNVEGLAQIGNGDHKTTVVGALARDALTRKCVVKFTTSEDFAAMNSRKRAFAEQNQFGKLYNRTDLKRKRRKAKKKAKEAGLPSNS
jgi:senataxin